ncbi:hypothetical protein V5O48_018843, partial [Marasmius crinis-equi]
MTSVQVPPPFNTSNGEVAGTLNNPDDREVQMKEFTNDLCKRIQETRRAFEDTDTRSMARTEILSWGSGAPAKMPCARYDDRFTTSESCASTKHLQRYNSLLNRSKTDANMLKVLCD